MVKAPVDIDGLIRSLEGLDLRDDEEIRAAVGDKCMELQKAYRGKRIPLAILEKFLESIRGTSGLSKTKLRKILQTMGICLRNCEVVGSRRALAEYLSLNPKLIIGRETAKEFELVRFCLVKVDLRRSFY